MKHLRFPLITVLLLAACIDPLPVTTSSAGPTLVVDGMITTDPGPYTIKLFMSSGIDQNDSPELVPGASVSISEDQGQVHILTELSPGIYSSGASDLRGETGRTYTLRIRLADGTEFRSTEETLLPAGDIDSLYMVYEENAINRTNRSLPQDAITFFVNGRSDPANTAGFQRWRSTTIYEFLTYPELRTTIVDGIVTPDPLPCSGYTYSGGVLAAIDTCICCSCWKYDYPTKAVVSPSRFPGENQYRHIAVAQSPVTGWRFFRKFYIEAEQMSLSENAYEFWKKVAAQQQGTGSLFQPNAIRIKGNMQCITNPGREVFGIFSASAIVRKSMFVTRNQLPKPIAAPDQVTFDCRYVIEGSLNEKPPFW